MATTTRAKRRKIEALEAKKQQLLEIQNETVDSQDSEDEEYMGRLLLKSSYET